MTHLKCSVKKLGKTFKLQKEILKTEMNHDENYADNWRDKKHEWVDYVNIDVLCTVFLFARHWKAMDEIIGFSRKDSLSSPG